MEMTHTETLSFFGSAARARAQLLDWPEEHSARDFFDTVVVIMDLLSQIHDEIAQTARDVGRAKTLDEATEMTYRLRGMQLKEALKAQNLCNALGEAGQRLAPFIANHPKLTPHARMLWFQLSAGLMQYEGGTAEMYGRALSDSMQELQSEPSLEVVKKKMQAIRSQLIRQKALFDGIAEEAKAKRAELA
jgi:hypothetical protein